MGARQFSANHFKFKQSMNSSKYIAHKKFNSCFKSMISDTYDSYVDYTFKVYDELSDTGSENKDIFNKICSSVQPLIYEKIKEFMYNYINEETFEGGVTKKVTFDLMKGVFEIYYDAILDSYRSLTSEYLIADLRKRFMALAEDRCCRELAYYDPNFVNILPLRLKDSLRIFSESSYYLTDMFINEYSFNVIMLLKDSIISSIIEILKELCGIELLVEDGDIHTILESISTVEVDTGEVDFGKLDYISDYKRLNKLAKDNGFNLVRCKGDHGIFKNDTGLVVIPQGRSIGKGLSFKIQKAILCLSN